MQLQYFVLVLALYAKSILAAVSPQCMREVQQASDCALTPIEQCFTQNGCQFPDGSQDHDDAPLDGRCACVEDLKQRVMPPLMSCVQAEFPGIRQKFLKLMGHTIKHVTKGMCSSSGDMKEAMKQKMREMMLRQCGGDQQRASRLEQCLEQQKEGGRSRMMECMQNISEGCRDEIRTSMCGCVNNILNNDPSVVDDALQCVRDSGMIERMPLPAQAIMRRANPQMVRGMISRLCNGGSGGASSFFQNIARALRGGRRGSGGQPFDGGRPGRRLGNRNNVGNF